jgi:hypothetical protein
MNEKVYLKDLLHFSPKQDEARKQALSHRYTLYGGAMAGGKSYWLRWMLVCLLVRWAQRGFNKVEVGLFCEDYARQHVERSRPIAQHQRRVSCLIPDVLVRQ